MKFSHPTQAVVEFPTPLAQVMVKSPGFAQERMWSFNLIGALDCKIIHMEVHLEYLGIEDTKKVNGSQWFDGSSS